MAELDAMHARSEEALPPPAEPYNACVHALRAAEAAYHGQAWDEFSEVLVSDRCPYRESPEGHRFHRRRSHARRLAERGKTSQCGCGKYRNDSNSPCEASVGSDSVKDIH